MIHRIIVDGRVVDEFDESGDMCRGDPPCGGCWNCVLVQAETYGHRNGVEVFSIREGERNAARYKEGEPWIYGGGDTYAETNVLVWSDVTGSMVNVRTGLTRTDSCSLYDCMGRLRQDYTVAHGLHWRCEECGCRYREKVKGIGGRGPL